MNLFALTGTIAIVALIFSIGWMILSAYMCYWAYKKKGILGLLLALFFNWIGWIVVACLPKEENPEREREFNLPLP